MQNIFFSEYITANKEINITQRLLLVQNMYSYTCQFFFERINHDDDNDDDDGIIIFFPTGTSFPGA